MHAVKFVPTNRGVTSAIIIGLSNVVRIEVALTAHKPRSDESLPIYKVVVIRCAGILDKSYWSALCRFRMIVAVPAQARTACGT